MLKYKPPFFTKKCWFSKTEKTPYIPSNSLYLLRYYINQNNCIFMTRKIWSFCGQILESESISHKMLKIFIFNFFQFDFFFSQNIFHCNIPLDRGFPMIPTLLNILEKVLIAWKISAMNKKSRLVTLAINI